jgi:hypothetical protein
VTNLCYKHPVEQRFHKIIFEIVTSSGYHRRTLVAYEWHCDPYEVYGLPHRRQRYDTSSFQPSLPSQRIGIRYVTLYFTIIYIYLVYAYPHTCVVRHLFAQISHQHHLSIHCRCHNNLLFYQRIVFHCFRLLVYWFFQCKSAIFRTLHAFFDLPMKHLSIIHGHD